MPFSGRKASHLTTNQTPTWGHPHTCSGYASEAKSSIVAIGLSVHTAPVEMREKLAVAADLFPRCIAELCAYPHVDEAAILSTCNRMEVYVVALSWHRGVREVEEWMSQVSISEAQLFPRF